MSFGMNSILGVHENALKVRSARAEILASNIANADTPGYKAQDIDFKSALQNAKESMSATSGITKTNSKHFGMSDLAGTGNLMFRQNLQPDTGDGNTVDINVERMAYMQNGLEYQTTLEFINSRINGIRSVLASE